MFIINLKTARVDALADKTPKKYIKARWSNQQGILSRAEYSPVLKCFLLACQSDFISDMNSIFIPEAS